MHHAYSDCATNHVRKAGMGGGALIDMCIEQEGEERQEDCGVVHEYEDK